jgi:hypothetical protein
MPTFRHGKTSRVLLNKYDLSPYLNDLSISQSVDPAEVTAFSSSAKSYIVGLRDGKISLGGFFDGQSTDAVDLVMSTAINGSGDDTYSVCPDTWATGKRAILASADQSSYEVSASVSDVVAVKFEAQVDGGVDEGYLISGNTSAGSTTVTTATTTAGTVLDLGSAGAAANIGVAHLHVTANTWSGTTTFTVYHSTDNISFASLTSFTVVAGSTTTSERKVLAAGTVNRYIRLDAVTAAGSGSITYTVSLARRNS